MAVRARQDGLMRILFLTLGVLVVALIVVLILMLATGGNGDADAQHEALIDSGHYVQGVSVGGVDVSGMKYADARANAQIQAKAEEVAAAFSYTFTVNGTEYTYSAEQLGLVSNIEQVLTDALEYGNEGTGAEIREQKATAQESGIDFPVGIYADEATVLGMIQMHKAEIDTPAQNATIEISDDIKGTAEADEKAEAEAEANGETYTTSVQYLEDLPGVTFIDEVTGVDVDAAALAGLMTRNVNSGDYSVIEAPAILTNPQIDVATLKHNTQRISRYTSAFEGSTLGDPARVTNIRLLAAIVNGTVIEFGQEWSINDAAGPRTDDTAKTVGWAYAPGIANGRYEDQVGGGVCQVSSTVYNAAIRAELEITDRRAHSWPSSYIPEGMDATISTGGPDLKFVNPYPMPIYLVSYLHENENKVTVEVFGPPLSHGYTVEFTHKLVQTIPAGQTIYHYNATKLPDGTTIAEGEQKTWVKRHDGQVWYVYKWYYDSDGNVVSNKGLFSENTYKAFTEEIYVNGQNPATATQPPTDTTDTE